MNDVKLAIQLKNMENGFALLKEEVKECGAVPVNQISPTRE